MYRIQTEGFFTWVDYKSIPENEHDILYYLKEAKEANPNKRVRCVDSSGRLLDIIN